MCSGGCFSVGLRANLLSKPLHRSSRLQIGSLPEEIDYELDISRNKRAFSLFTIMSPNRDSAMSAPALSSALALPLAFLPTALVFALSLAVLPLPAEALTLQDAVGGLESLVTSAGPLGPVLFIAAYVVATVFLIPASVLTVGAGFLFGPILGTVVVSIASTLGATAAFLVGRYLARPAVARRASADARFAAVDSAIAAQGAKIVLLMRLSPLFPFSLLNYGLSLTSIPLGSYVAASWAGMLPGTIAYVALGGAGKAAAETAAGAGTSPLQLAMYALGALATLGATVLISRAASQALKEASQLEEPLATEGQEGREMPTTSNESNGDHEQ